MSGILPVLGVRHVPHLALVQYQVFPEVRYLEERIQMVPVSDLVVASTGEYRQGSIFVACR